MPLLPKIKAPNFTLPDQDGKTHKLSEYKGKWVLLYFYPKDDTTGCTTEACTISAEFNNFQKLKVVVLGVSVDSIKSHKKFEQKYNLPFTLLADEEKKVVNLYKVWAKKSMYGREYMGTLRTSYLIDPKGKIVKVYEKVNPAPLFSKKVVLDKTLNHAQKVLEDLKELKKG